MMMSSLQIPLINQKESVEQRRKQECLNAAVSKGKVHLQDGENNGHMNWLMK